MDAQRGCSPGANCWNFNWMIVVMCSQCYYQLAHASGHGLPGPWFTWPTNHNYLKKKKNLLVPINLVFVLTEKLITTTIFIIFFLKNGLVPVNLGFVLTEKLASSFLFFFFFFFNEKNRNFIRKKIKTLHFESKLTQS